MRLIPEKYEVDKKKPFGKDLLGRKEFAESLLDLVKDCEHELVIALEGDWGEGKSTFVKQWRALLDLEERQIKNVYFDAFEMDYQEDAFAAVASAIYSVLKEEPYKKETEGKKFKERMTDLGLKLAPIALKSIIHLSTMGALSGLRTEDTKEVHNAFTKGYSEVMSDHIMSRLTSFKEDKDVVEGFKEKLGEITASYTYDEEGKDGPPVPLVIIIDELDRCKPSYALNVIEVIKHFFSVPTLRFVLVMQSDALVSAVKHTYGIENALEYLQKFIHVIAKIPHRRCLYDSAADDIDSYTSFLIKEMFPHESESTVDYMCRQHGGYIKEACSLFQLSKRQTETALRYLILYYWKRSKREHKITRVHGQYTLSAVAVLCAMKAYDYKLYDGFVNRSLKIDDIKEIKLKLTGEVNFNVYTDFALVMRLNEMFKHDKEQLIAEGIEGKHEVKARVFEQVFDDDVNYDLLGALSKDIDFFCFDVLNTDDTIGSE